MPRLKPTRFFTPLALLVGAVLSSEAGPRQASPPGAPLIDHDPVECVVEQQHPLFRADVGAPDGLHTVKLYFHAQDYNDYYYVEMVDQGGGAYQASLPIALPETEGFVYYIEAVDLLFNTSRTEEYLTLIAPPEECEDSEEGPPPIVVGSTAPGASAIPPGFAATGIERFISSTGATTGVGGGGIGAVGALAIGGGVAAGVTAGVLGTKNDDPSSEPDSPIAPPPTPDPPDAPPAPSPEPEPANTDPEACFRTDPDPPVVDINEPVRFDASCSMADEPLAQLADEIVTYHWEFNDGKPDKEGRVVNHAYARAGTFPANLTVTDSAGNTDEETIEVIVREDVAPPGGGGGGGGGGGPDANLGVNITGPTNATAGNVNLTVNVSNTGTLAATNAVLRINCGQPMTVSSPFLNCTPPGSTTSKTCTAASIGAGGSGSVGVVVNAAVSFNCQANISSDTVDNSPGNNNDRHSVAITQLSPDLIPSIIDTSFTSRLDVPPSDGTVRGQVVLNGGSLQETNSSAPFRHRVEGQKGRNTVEARWVAGTGEGRWVFNFSNSLHFVDGSLAVDSGQVIVREGSRIVFRASPTSPPIRFRFRLTD